MTDLQPEDLQIDTFRDAAPTQQSRGAVKIVHKPTGETVLKDFGPDAELSSQLAAKDAALAELREKLEPEETAAPPDPLLAQAMALPEFLKGTDGDASQHVTAVTAADEADPVDDEGEDPFGYTPPDPSTFTAD